MLDINLIRKKPDWVKAEIAKLNADAPINQILILDTHRRELLQEVEQLKQTRNRVSKEIGRTKDSDARQFRIAEMRSVSDRITTLDQQLRQVEKELRTTLLWVPNLPHSTVPVGAGEEENITLPQEGALPEFDFEPLPHWDLGPKLNIIDFERGVKLSGTRFYLLKGPGSRLQRALIQWMLDLHGEQHAYTEIYPPVMVRREMMVGAAQLPKFAENIYHDTEDDFWWIGTAEVALTNIHRDEILPLEALPLKYVAHTPCFRREKMSAGRDVRGIKRGHQFDKVEMYRLTTPETSYAALDEMVDQAAAVCQRAVVSVCVGIRYQSSRAFIHLPERYGVAIVGWRYESRWYGCDEVSLCRAVESVVV